MTVHAVYTRDNRTWELQSVEEDPAAAEAARIDVALRWPLAATAIAEYPDRDSAPLSVTPQRGFARWPGASDITIFAAARP